MKVTLENCIDAADKARSKWHLDDCESHPDFEGLGPITWITVEIKNSNFDEVVYFDDDGKFLKRETVARSKKKSSMKWKKETPSEEGWYWMKYKGKHGMTTCPARVIHLQGLATIVESARADTFMEGPKHGGPGLKYQGKIDTSIRFGDRIPSPED